MMVTVTSLSPDPARHLGHATADSADAFVSNVRDALIDGSFRRLVLAKPRPGHDITRVTIREVILRTSKQLSFVYSETTNDVTKNLATTDGVELIRSLVSDTFLRAHLTTACEQIDLSVTKKGSSKIHRSPLSSSVRAPTTTHDRDKLRFVSQDRPYLVEVGITDHGGQIIPVMSRKWKQINKFVEIVDGAIKVSALSTASSVTVIDFGSGKGYLTFALHDHLTASLGKQAIVHGVELRQGLVDQCNLAARRTAAIGLSFAPGEVSSTDNETNPTPIDMMVALHACDTATDIALHRGITGGAQIIVSSPCCHKELRAQIKAPSVLDPMLRFGVHLGQEADMVTDTLRALLLEAHGYDTKVFEFIGLEDTSKNKMILAVKLTQPNLERQARATAQIVALKAFYGIEHQHLETLLSSPSNTIA
jgi:Methyltransferase domain